MGPLEGIKVVELATVVAAPTAGRVMCDFGADVVKIEALAGDDFRKTGVNFSLPAVDECNPMFTLSNSNKKIIPLDLKSKEGQEIVFKLLEDADVVISNIRMASLARLGLDYESLKEKYPKLVYAHFSGYGPEGPDRNTPGFDMTAFWLRNGAMTDWKETGSFPMHPGYAFGDVATSNALLSGILMGLMGRQVSGQGTLVTVSLMGNGIWCNFTDIISSQEPFNRDKTHDKYHQVQPFDALYECADGKYMGIFCNSYAVDRVRYAKLFDMEEILEDPRYETVTSLRETGALAECIDKVSKVMLTKTTDEWSKILKENNFSIGIATTAGDVTKDEQAIANGFVEDVDFAGSIIKMPTPPIRFSTYDRLPTQPTKEMGAFTDAILKDLGYGQDEINKMKQNGVII
ncbi:CaiB/BaiF CoA-transferase family protein [Chakrabartyella piscis]|uniref:CaiB/BaiF CoA transferase family protein n=1 Tax=Chakrabartyella piscis TaxID=2918914 RepID=UPI0029585A3F|nr:CaiB/BaiF CoA-transferase family protein [Chakrabartyella piscis]